MWDITQSLKKRIRSMLLLLLATGVLFFYHWIEAAEATAHVMPQVKQQEIGEILEKAQRAWEERNEVFLLEEGLAVGAVLSVQEFALLREQTGLGEAAIKSLWQQRRLQELLIVQEIYFAPVVIESIKTTPLTVSEWLTENPVKGYEGMPLVEIRDGDILLTKNSRFLGWRNGHAGLVVDAKEGLVLEAIMLGSPSQLCKIDKWESYPSFMVLRLKEEFMISTEETEIEGEAADSVGKGMPGNVAEWAASYAAEHLVGVPYQLLAGVFSRKLYQVTSEKGTVVVENGLGSSVAEVTTEALAGTQCAHLVWYAYKQFGIDLDSDGGCFITPYDIQNSPYLEIVQSYGY